MKKGTETGFFFSLAFLLSLVSVGLAWFWVVLEFLNGCAHITWAASAGAYRPGLATAPVLVAIAWVLGWQLMKAHPWTAGETPRPRARSASNSRQR